VFIVIIVILALMAAWAVYKGQDVRRLDFKNLVAEFWPKQQLHVAPSKDLGQQTTDNNTPAINQHTEGNQSPAVNVAPGGTASFNYGARKDGSSEE
jgi:hypothetical protein